MKKLIILIGLLLLIVPTITALLDCEEVITTNEVPCSIITTWDYPDSCINYTIQFYNSTPELMGATTLDDYGSTGRCNTTFNFSTVDSYIFNISSGDSGRIIVEVDDTMNIALAIVFSLFAILFIVGGIYLLFFKDKGAEANY